MEHLAVLVIEFIKWVDQRSIRPLAVIIPNLNDLRLQPSETLDREDIVIGDHRRWGTVVALGFLLGLVSTVALTALCSALGIRPLRGGGKWTALISLVPLTVLMTCLSIVWMLRLFRGAQAVLSRDGVTFRSRGSEIWCPWELFHSVGLPFFPARDRALLPINTRALGKVVKTRREEVVAQGEGVTSRVLKIRTGGLCELRALFVVEVKELAELLHHLGLCLGLPETGALEAESVAEAPRLVRAPDGWIRASLVHLTFPPCCTDCGNFTSDRKEMTTQSESFSEGFQTLPLSIPFCQDCQQTQRRVARRGMWIGVGVGALVTVVVLAALLVMLKDVWILALVFPFGVVGLGLGALIGYNVVRSRTQPVRLKRYIPSEGSVCLLFRNDAYADALMELHHGEEEEAAEDEEEQMGMLSTKM